jgi:hypothetical protein
VALVIGALIALVSEKRPEPSYSFARAENGTIWRLDNRTGRVSVCGVSITGLALAQAEIQLGAHMRAAGANPSAQAALGPQIDDLDGLSRPRCSAWSEPPEPY